MSVVTDECMNAAMTAFYQSKGGFVTSMRAALAVVTPLIVAQERERIANIPVDPVSSETPNADWVRGTTDALIAYRDAIRALGDAT